MWKEGRKDEKTKRRKETWRRDRKGREEGVKSKIEVGIYSSSITSL